MSDLLNILILEEHSADVELIARELQRAGIRFRANQVVTELEFSAQLATFTPDVIIADYFLPPFNGLSVLALAQKRAPEIPFIFVCASWGEETAIEALKQGASDYILKQHMERIAPAVIRAVREAGERSQRKQAESELRRMNRLYAVLSQVNEELIHADSREQLLLQACRIAVERGGFEAAWIGWLDTESRAVVPVARFGGPEEYYSRFQIFADNRPEARGPSGTAVREGRPCVVNDFIAEVTTDSWRNAAQAVGVKSVASFPIRFGGKVCGVFSLYSHEKNMFLEKEVSLLTGVADNISLGLERLELEAKRQQAKSSLKENELRYRTVVKETGQILYDYELATGVIQWQGAVEEVVGYTWEEMQHIHVQGWVERVHPDDRPQTLMLLDKAINHGLRYHVEYRFRRKDGTYVYIEEHGSFLMDELGKPAHMLGIMSNITERKNTEEQLRSQARLLDLAHDAILVRDLEDNISYWNESAERLYGWTMEQALGRNATELLGQTPEKSNEIKQAVLREEEWSGELAHITKDGQEVRVETRLTLVRDQDGNPKSILAINTDITERKKLETQFLRAQRMESLGTLAGGIAHDLNNVLAPIMMAVKLVEVCPGEADRSHLLEMIRASAQRGADLVRQVLSFCRGVEGRRIECQIAPIVKDLNHILRETFPKSINVQTEVAWNLWPVMADPTQIHQVMLNLCVNARDAMPNGGTLAITAENVVLDAPHAVMAKDGKPSPHVRIDVRDTGTGIPDEIREKIFDPFFTTKEFGQGTGLGLSTSLAIIKSHGGFINLYSEPGKGTAFKVYLPSLAPLNPKTSEVGEAQFPRGNGELILLVDDEASVRTIVRQTLQTFGYRVLSVSNGAEAIEIYEQHTEDIALLLTDMMMPVMDGPTAIQALRRLNPNLKVIAASGLSPEAHMAKAPGDTVRAFLPKPYTTEMLLTTVYQVLQQTISSRLQVKEIEGEENLLRRSTN